MFVMKKKKQTMKCFLLQNKQRKICVYMFTYQWTSIKFDSQPITGVKGLMGDFGPKGIRGLSGTKGIFL